MFQIAYSDEQFERIVGEQTIAISPEVARRRANGYLAGHISLMVAAGSPTLILRPGSPPLWRVPALLSLPEQNREHVMGFVDIDAQEGSILTLTAAELERMQSLAHVIAAHFAPDPTAAG